MIPANNMKSKDLILTQGTIVINKNIEHVFDFFTNPGNDSLWRAEINKSIVNGPLQVGVIVSEYSHLSKKVPDNLVELKCKQFDKNATAVYETSEDADFYIISQRRVRSVSSSSTEVFYSLSFDKSIVKFALGFALPKFIISLKANSDMKKYLRQLKAKLEKDE
jgi:hypothetical protein